MALKKTSIYLDDALDRVLAQRAADEGLTKAEWIRRGLEGLATRPQRAKPTVGVFSSGIPDLASNDEKYAAETDWND
ncbi:ribbon-helix-helix domain-containing protein [Paraconexibacter antarcticus]|uniref:Ribbon-helix-helix domain-containing protein n=1 Tax=Paraconexibacter antarcticus TaxID=2949664 RepID=A0ABY5DU81_9ACTN|nr:CopG family transcriptional regulator [Paraconexibacter antarcticus]UTI64257.1 ribbon-helix-helix domain-containing protein [Paraconexibacter antarcticus]